jgi:hypothetical protein
MLPKHIQEHNKTFSGIVRTNLSDSCLSWKHYGISRKTLCNGSKVRVSSFAFSLLFKVKSKHQVNNGMGRNSEKIKKWRLKML